ncbi:uncharacterized protein KD926_001623 [Aspergillus affinis]|uniref:uncharacterized protein n=1 Tax=Aspergillus affinis TaxID=1070780 RepID=UPI0022FE1660|nr:uncharacterized protein KD926_001623 [Aspergillus affinis]KAI9036610.1 hypothetical protein KD926_001623 [Aspergillus affinis]
MTNGSSEVVFAASSSPTDPACVFPYVDGLIKASVPRRRGRPVGSRKRSNVQTRVKKYPAERGARYGDDDQFQFINLNAQTRKIDQGARKTIRRTAMLSYVQDVPKQSRNIPGTAKDEIAVLEEPLFSQPLQLSLGRADPFNTMPIQFEPYMHDLLVFYSTTCWKTLYSIEERTGFNPMVDYWLPLAFNDAALLNILLGCAASFRFRSQFRSGCPILIRHLNEAMKIVNHKLTTTFTGEDVSDETLAVIATLAMIQKTIGSSNEWNIHMTGLKRLVDLRGGMGSLDDKPFIKSKILRYAIVPTVDEFSSCLMLPHSADLCGSVDIITRQPYFNPHYEELPLNNPRYLSLPLGFRDLDVILGLDECLKNIILTLQATLENTSTLRFTRDQSHAAQIRFSLTSAQYALLSMHCGDLSSPINRAQETCRVAVLLFTATAFKELPSSLFGILKRLTELLGDSETCNWLTPAFKSWALCLATASLPFEARELSLSLLSSILSNMGIETEEQLALLLSNFLREDASHQQYMRVIREEWEQHGRAKTFDLS